MASIGIPSSSQYIPHSTVEEIATHFNKEYRELFSCDGMCVDVESFADQYFQISFLYDEIDAPEGARVFARLDDDSGPRITINTKHQELFTNKPQFLKSTIGHEVGHFALEHFKKLTKGSNNLSLFGDEPVVQRPCFHRSSWKHNGLSSEDLLLLLKAAPQNEKARQLLKSLDDKFEPDWMFYQAEHFSMCLLISKDLLVKKIETENHSFESWHSVYRLAESFDVTPSMMRVRLEKLKFLKLDDNNQPCNGPMLTEKKLF